MRSLTLKELLAATATTEQGLKSLRRRNHIALAWGRCDAYESLSYLALDCVGMTLTEKLGLAYGVKGFGGLTETAAMVRVHCDVWARCVAEAEQEYKSAVTSNVRFCVVDFERAGDRKKAHLVGGSDQTSDEAIATAIAQSPQAKGFVATRINTVNISHMLTVIRTNAMAHGIDLTAPFTFMPAPDSAEFAELMQPFEEAKQGAVIEVSNRRKLETVARRTGNIVRQRAEALQ